VLPDKVIAKNCEVYIGEDSRIPVVHVLPKAYRGTCPFLRNGECSVHTIKPVVCAVFPLARMHTPEGKAFYALQETTCGDKGNVHTVREWLREFNIPDNDTVGKLWSEAMIWCVQYMQRKKKSRNEEKNEVWNRMLFYLYIFFDIQKPFEDQLRTNFSVLKSLLTNGKEE
jgi:Fe-S-cluster containining protein